MKHKNVNDWKSNIYMPKTQKKGGTRKRKT